MSILDFLASSEGLIKEVCPPGWPKLHSSDVLTLCAMDLPVSSSEFVREVCPPDQLRMYSSDVPALIHGSVGPSGVCSGAVIPPLELVSIFFGCSGVDVEGTQGRASDLPVYGDHLTAT